MVKNYTSKIMNNLKIYNSNKDSIIRLNNNDFIHGTKTITKPGIYFLNEDIIFEPNKFNNCKPTENQRKNLPYSHPDYNFGFFACICY